MTINVRKKTRLAKHKKTQNILNKCGLSTSDMKNSKSFVELKLLIAKEHNDETNVENASSIPSKVVHDDSFMLSKFMID